MCVCVWVYAWVCILVLVCVCVYVCVYSVCTRTMFVCCNYVCVPHCAQNITEQFKKEALERGKALSASEHDLKGTIVFHSSQRNLALTPVTFDPEVV